MAVTFCAKCGHKVSTMAPACPGCGAPPAIAEIPTPNSSGETAADPGLWIGRFGAGRFIIRRPTLEFLLVCSGGVIFALAFCYALLGHLSTNGFVHDWDFAGELHWVSYYSVAYFRQLPLWNPYKCGGIPLLANPQSRMLTPFFLVHLGFGPVVGAHLEIILHVAVGWLGGYVLARVQGLSWLAGVACGSVFAGSSWLYLHMGVGHVVFLPSAYLPWIAALMWLGMTRQRLVYSALAGLLVAVTFGEGGVYPVTQAGLLIGMVALVLAAVRRSSWPLLALLVFGAFAVGFSAIKLLPTYLVLEVRPRPMDSGEVYSLGQLYTGLFSFNQDLYRPSFSASSHFDEYGAYIGFIAATLAILGSFSSSHRALPWRVSGVAFLVLAMGEFAPYAPWKLLHEMPIFSQQRVPTRFLIPFTLMVGVAAAFGVDFLRRRLRPYGAILAAILVIAMIFDLWRIGPPNLRYALGGKEPVFAPSPEFRQIAGNGSRIMLPLAKSNRGAIFCYDYFDYGYPTRVRGYNERDAYRGEQYLLGQGTVKLSEWTPNALSYDVDTASPNVMVVNQNYDPAWRLVEGDGEVFSEGGLIGVRIGAGRQHLKLAYRSYPFLIGLAMTMLSFAATFVLWRFEAPQRSTSGPTRPRAPSSSWLRSSSPG